MGSICSCCWTDASDKMSSYRNENYGNELLKEFLPRMSAVVTTKIIIVKLKYIKELQVATPNLNHPFVELKLYPDDRVVGDQKQRSTVKPDTTSPRWVSDDCRSYY